jgi:hypothetical protein
VVSPTFRCSTTLVAITVLLVGLSSKAQQSGAQQPIVTFTDSEAPPATLEDMWQKACCVVRVRVQSARARELTSTTGRAGRPITEHSAVVTEVMKGTIKVGETIQVSLPVGIVRHPDGSQQESRAAGMTAFATGDDVLLFLLPSPPTGGYSIAYGPVGFYQLNYHDVAVPPGARGWSAFGGKTSIPKQEFLGIIRLMKNPSGR